jgi:hypothetical protein
MKCSTCTTVLLDGSTECHTCGAIFTKPGQAPQQPTGPTAKSLAKAGLSALPWRLVLIVGVVAGAWYWHTNAPLVSAAGGGVSIQVDGIDFGFTKGAEFADSYMLFSGGEEAANSINRVWLTGLPMAISRQFYSTYPDFYMCSSPAAEKAKDQALTMRIVPATTGVRGVLIDSVNTVQKDGSDPGVERAAVKMSGARLTLVSAKVHDTGEDYMSHYDQKDFFLVEAAQAVTSRNVVGVAGN